MGRASGRRERRIRNLTISFIRHALFYRIQSIAYFTGLAQFKKNTMPYPVTS
jgi:hypothetical protein